MSEEEQKQLFQDLTELLRQYGLPWVSAQVQDVIASGQDRRIELYREGRQRLARVLSEFRSQGKLLTPEDEPLTTTIPYTTQEQLILLIDAIEQASVEVALMQSESLDLLEADSVVFLEETTGITHRLIRRDPNRAEMVVGLRDLLNRLRHEVGG